MTINEMTNDELDRHIAELKGTVSRDHRETYPCYTTDTRYAMELLKEMVDTGNTIVLFKENDKYTLDGEEDNCVGVADTPERAIAEAYAEWREK